MNVQNGLFFPFLLSLQKIEKLEKKVRLEKNF